MMVASEVPTATFMRTASSMPMVVNRCHSTGTMTMPPPTPSRPAVMPATAPAASSRAPKMSRSDSGRSIETAFFVLAPRRPPLPAERLGQPGGKRRIEEHQNQGNELQTDEWDDTPVALKRGDHRRPRHAKGEPRHATTQGE